MIHTKGFYIVSPGDYSVGIFQADWHLSGDFYFEEAKDLEEFKLKLKEAFELVADPIYVQTIEVRIEEITAEEKYYCPTDAEGAE